MKHSILMIAALLATAVLQLPMALSQVPPNTASEADSTPATINSSQPSFAPAPPPAQLPAASQDSSFVQEQLKWTEQRANLAEEQARNAQRNIPLMVLLVFFAAPLSFAGGVFFARYKNYQQLNEALRSLMERGVAVPPELFTPRAPTVPGMSDFRKGLLLIWSGLGAMFLLAIILNGSRAWSLGLIPMFTGLAYLVLWKLECRKAAV
jgi:hypothetical protein